MISNQSCLRSLFTDNRSLEMGCPIRKFPDQSLFAAPRDLSQRTTSFIASQRQGIRQIPFRHLIVLEIRKRTASLHPGGRTQAKRPASADEPQSRFPIRKDQFCFKHIRDPAVRRGSRLVCCRSQTTDDDDPRRGLAAPPKSRHSRLRCRNRMRFLFTMSVETNRRQTTRAGFHVRLGRIDRLSSKIPPRRRALQPSRRNSRSSNSIFHRNAPPVTPTDDRNSADEPCPPTPSSAIRHLVEPDGIEPTTSCLQSTRSPN